MSTFLISSVLIAYFLVLILISWITSRNATTETFFTGNRQSPWYLVAFGMIGTSLSGVTFISVPGKVYSDGMAYFQIVIGYVFGYIVIAKVLMPLYYKMNLVSIYEFLEERFGVYSYKTGAFIFIFSRTLGSALRLFLATLVLHLFLFKNIDVPYWLTATITVALIWVYTFRGGIKTIVFTDTFQTLFLVSALIISIVVISSQLNVSFSDLYAKVSSTMTSNNFSMTKIFFFEDYKSANYFPKMFLGGMFLAIAMTGLDQDLMQKNLTCKTIGDAQKNMYSFTAILVIVNFLFLLLGGALYVYANQKGVDLPMNAAGTLKTDHVFPFLALNNFGTLAGIFFLLGITASSYASSDSALAALTTGFCIDFLNFKKKDEATRKRQKLIVHISFSLLFLIIILIVNAIKVDGLIDVVLKVASYTYGPLLGLFFFGILTKRRVFDKFVPFICVLAPLVCFLLDKSSASMFNGFVFGNEILIINGLITFLALTIFSRKHEHNIK